MTKKPKTVERVRNPYPCSTTGCAGVLVPRNAHGDPIDLEREGAAKWTCSRGGGPGCGFAVDARDDDNVRTRCPADGAPTTFDPELVGDTCGGLTLRGWDRCGHCGGIWVSRRGVPWRGGVGGDGRWRIASSGRSLDADGTRLRAEGRKTDGVATLMARIARLPAFEIALEQIASGKLDGAAAALLAADALALGEQIEDLTDGDQHVAGGEP